MVYLSTGPIVCSDAPCPAPGSAAVTIFPLTGCQEVVINSPGFPDGYVGTPSSSDACATTETITLTTSFPVAAFNSPRFPATYDLPSECYYTITSPADTVILLEFIGNLDVNPFEDFVYIYDNVVPANPKLLRIVSDVVFRNFREIYTETNSVQVAFKTTSTNQANGFFVRVSYEALPPDFTCVVKNPYISPHFAYPVQLHGSPGRPSISPYEMSFDVYRYKGVYNIYDSLPTNSKLTVEPHTFALSLPSTCDTKEGSSRLGVFVCSVKGHEFIESIDIPAIVNPKSEFVNPVGRFTKTVSVGDAQITFTVDNLPSVQHALRWKFNGLVQQKWNGQSTITITNIKTADGGIYECFIREGYNKDFDVVRYRLIVRACPPLKYGLECLFDCSCGTGIQCNAATGACP
ncbi:hypothetical protein HOLleu_04026 [Holothuria leucospilota]|uniref:Uncharacterized protein n=1 Tax=Holothuria leucospilota TaxID=206669 RepID=A0A9Q1CU71_HOLLE|nr:hypothetical protein HOLleu_04026 [Holothuria leucospilota]